MRSYLLTTEDAFKFIAFKKVFLKGWFGAQNKLTNNFIILILNLLKNNIFDAL